MRRGAGPDRPRPVSHVKAKATFSALACRAGRPAAALLAAALAGCAHDRHSGRDAHDVSPPARPILRAVTHGPKYHWFGYYDLQPFDPSQRYLLGMEAVSYTHLTLPTKRIV